MELPVRAGRLAAIAKEQGKKPGELVLEAIHQEGSTLGAANRIGIAPNTVRYWLKKLGYEARPGQSISWVKVEDGG